MTPKQTALVKESWELVSVMDASIVGQLFYSRLFEANPELRAMFRTPVPEQSKKLIAMLSYIVSRLDRVHTILPEVQKMAQRHVHYGVKESHYAMVGAALIWTLQKGLSDKWNGELEDAWIDCYEFLSAAMIDASAEMVLY